MGLCSEKSEGIVALYRQGPTYLIAPYFNTHGNQYQDCRRLENGEASKARFGASIVGLDGARFIRPP